MSVGAAKPLIYKTNGRDWNPCLVLNRQRKPEQYTRDCPSASRQLDALMITKTLYRRRSRLAMLGSSVVDMLVEATPPANRASRLFVMSPVDAQSSRFELASDQIVSVGSSSGRELRKNGEIQATIGRWAGRWTASHCRSWIHEPKTERAGRPKNPPICRGGTGCLGWKDPEEKTRSDAPSAEPQPSS